MDFLNSSFACILKKTEVPKKLVADKKIVMLTEKKANLPVFKHAMLIHH